MRYVHVRKREDSRNENEGVEDEEDDQDSELVGGMLLLVEPESSAASFSPISNRVGDAAATTSTPAILMEIMTGFQKIRVASLTSSTGSGA